MKSKLGGALKKAFTLIELMLVVIIIGVLASLVVPRMTGKAEKARRVAAEADIKTNISAALDLYEMDVGNYPARLEDLAQPVSVSENWDGPYLRKISRDPWGRPYYYKSPGEYNRDYDLASFGKDGILGTEDDITNWE
ncbi:MAG: type II secretion system major pseudopilin GspG [Candidatus Omnitrophota bacterium]